MANNGLFLENVLKQLDRHFHRGRKRGSLYAQ